MNNSRNRGHWIIKVGKSFPGVSGLLKKPMIRAAFLPEYLRIA